MTCIGLTATALIAMLFVCSAMANEVQAQAWSTTGGTGAPAGIGRQPQPAGTWKDGVGEGFRSGAKSWEIGAGANYGVAAFGGKEEHHLALTSLSFGRMAGDVRGEGHWYRGNWDVRLELFTGAEFLPDQEWLVGLAPHLRYCFAKGTRWIPFVDAGAGVTATGIGPPDLSGTFEFNLQGGGGLHWFLKDDLALTVETHYVHWSCAGLHKPNLGLNGVSAMLGLTFFF
jgi:lipid A 3-O-deacylase